MNTQTKLQEKSKSDANLNIGKHTSRARCQCCALKPMGYLREQRIQREKKKLNKTSVQNIVKASNENLDLKRNSFQPQLKQIKPNNRLQRQKSPYKELPGLKQYKEERRFQPIGKENLNHQQKIQQKNSQDSTSRQLEEMFEFKLIFEQSTYKRQFRNPEQYSEIIKKLMELLEK